MADDLREHLLASCAEMGEAMVLRSALESAGVPCRVADLAHVPAHMFGIAGAMGRSVGVWVLASDVERATELLGTLASPEAGVDEEALAREALAAAPADDEQQDVRAAAGRRSGGPAGVALGIVALAVAALLASRGCA